MNYNQLIRSISTKMLFLLMFSCCLYAGEYNSQDVRVSVARPSGATIKSILNDIEGQTSYLFVYQDNIDLSQIVHLDVSGQEVIPVLNELFSKTNIGYRIEGNYISLYKKDNAPASTVAKGSNSASQQERTVMVKVKDINGPIAGAGVMVKGTTIGNVTDIDGQTELRSVPENAVLQVSFLGYFTSEVTLSNGQTSIEVTLREDTETLDDVVVVGYGTQRRSEVTGSITSIKGDDVSARPAGSLAEALSGQAAGVMVSMTDNAPGASPSILIRGAASVNGMNPLYVVDGVRQDAGFEFNMRDVESIEILKDAGSAAIYGAQAAGGVILITTKHGSADKQNINVNARYGLRQLNSNIKLLNRDEFIDAQSLIGRDILLSHGVSSREELPDVDWMDLMYNTGTEQEYSVSLSGAGSKVKYFLSAGYYNQKGIYIDNGAKRFSVRSNIDVDLSKHVTVGLSLYGNLRENNPARSGGIPTRTSPAWSPVDENGNYTQAPGYIGGPNLYGNELTFHYSGKNYGLNVLAYMNVKIIDGLVFRINGSGKFTSYSNNGFSELGNWGTIVNNAYMDAYAGTGQDLLYNATLTYDKSFGNHNLKLMAGTEASKEDGYNIHVHAIDFPIKVAQSLNLSSNASKSADDSWPIARSLSFFGRINYSYKNRYILTANIRRDGSDKFAPSNRWGTFPSVNVAWRFSEEPFVKKALPWIEGGKIRASYGILGNDGIGQFLYAKAYEGSILYNYGGSNQSIGWGNYKVPNSEIKWEEVHQADFGVDLTFLKGRLNVVYDYYNRQTKDMLYWRTLPMGAGVGYYDDENPTMPVNIGKVQNTGHEVTINWNDDVNGFEYGVGLNMSFNKNKVLDLGIDGAVLTDGSYNRTESGKPMGLLYGYKAIGIFQDQAQVDEYNARARAAGQAYYFRPQTGPGDLIYDDFGKGYVSGASQTYIGNPWPAMVMGLNLSAAWKGFDIKAMFSGAFGFDIYNALKPRTQQFFGDENTTKDIYKTSFFGNNGVTDQPRPGMWIDGNYVSDASLGLNYYTISSFWVEKGDYVKLKDLTIGYTLPEKALKKIKIDKVRVYFTANNLFTITNYSGLDPEIGGTSSTGSGSVRQRGVEYLTRYVPSRLYSFGLDITF